MPRIRDTESLEEVVVKKPRAPRARAVSVSGDSPAPRKRAPRKVAAPVEPTVSSEVVPQRKAPTTIAKAQVRSKRNLRVFISVLTVCLIIIGSAVVVGTSDKGVIDVVAVVNERNEKINRGEVRDAVTGETITQTVSVQNADTRPNGGLQIADPSLVPAVVPPSAETATTTETGTSTEATAATSTPPQAESNASTTPAS
jgi:hypothetical protein